MFKLIKFLFVIVGLVFSLISAYSVVIPSCDYNLTTAGEVYTLTSDLTHVGGKCLFIKNNSITLDCQGNSIIGDGNYYSGSYGIKAENVNNITVNNCRIYTQRSDSIRLEGVLNSSFNNLLVDEGQYNHLYVRDSSYNAFNRINFTPFDANRIPKIQVTGFSGGSDYNSFSNLSFLGGDGLISSNDHSTNNNFSNFVINNERAAFSISGCNSNFINVTDFTGNKHYLHNNFVTVDGVSDIASLNFCGANNSVIKNLNFSGAIYLSESHNVIIDNVNISNIDFPLFFDYSSSASVTNFNFDNVEDGLYLVESHNSVYENFTITNVENAMVDFSYNSDYNNFTNFLWENSEWDGAYFDTSNGNKFENGIIRNIENAGFYNQFNTIFKNITFDNLTYGLDDVSGDKLFNLTFTNLKKSVFTVGYNPNCVTHLELENVTVDGFPVEYYNYSVSVSNKQLGALILCDADNSIFDNISIVNTGSGISFAKINNVDFSNIYIVGADSGLNSIYISSNINLFNSSILNSTESTIQLGSLTNSNFYNNFFDDNGISNHIVGSGNNFNSSIFGNNIGNYWSGLGQCNSTETRGSFDVCTNPSSYHVYNTYYDYAPLVLDSFTNPPVPVVPVSEMGISIASLPSFGFISSIVSFILLVSFLLF